MANIFTWISSSYLMHSKVGRARRWKGNSRGRDVCVPMANFMVETDTMLLLLLLLSRFSRVRLCVTTCLVAKSYLTFCDPMDCSTPGFPVFHYLPEFSQIHVHQVSDNHPTISSSVTPFSPCPQFFPASGSFPVSQLFASGGKVLELQHQSF